MGAWPHLAAYALKGVPGLDSLRAWRFEDQRLPHRQDGHALAEEQRVSSEVGAPAARNVLCEALSPVGVVRVIRRGRQRAEGWLGAGRSTTTNQVPHKRVYIITSEGGGWPL